ncbi:MAG: hypothetical protein ACSHX8_04930 [Opitutaceae bacterium]
MKTIGKEQILSALRRLGQLAQEEHIELELSIYGGCAMMLAFDRRMVTRDVDAIFHPSNSVRPLIAQVAEEMQLPEEWLNDDVRQFLAPEGAMRELPLDLPGIKVTTPTASYLLAMKALAGRRALPGYEGDEADLRYLIAKMKIQSFEEVQAHIDRYYPDDVPSEPARALITQIIQEETA